jgi:lantibiotic biosynthesis protein
MAINGHRLEAYRDALTDNTRHHAVLSALLHMHHNRARLIDRADEAIFRVVRV